VRIFQLFAKAGRAKDPDFALHGVVTAARADFYKESRMKSAELRSPTGNPVLGHPGILLLVRIM
jgi:hypothetical protein